MRPTAALVLLALLASPVTMAAEGKVVRPADPGSAARPAEARLPPIRLHGDALAGKQRTMTVSALEELGPLTEWTIVDPYKRQTARYQGIRLKELVALLAPTALKVRMRAVNDYIVVFDRKEWETLPILLATRDDNAHMAVANKGPARIVYRQTHENEQAMQVHAPKWIWQVVDVEFIAH